MTTVTGYPRLHAGLFDLGTATPRQYGGIGLAIEGQPTIVSALPAAAFRLSGLELVDARSAADLRRAIDRISPGDSTPPVSVTIHSVPPQHVGLGTKTTLLLAVLTAISKAANLPLTDDEVRAASGRGGTSGIGIYSFFTGGLVIDGGHRADPPRTFRPSSATVPLVPPPLLLRVSIPTDWTVTLILPDGTRRAGPDEIAAFQALTPINDDDVRRTIALAVMGLAASAASSDFATFAEALNEMQLTGFKAKEIAAQPKPVCLLLRKLAALPRCAAAMSSMGPLLFVVTAGPDKSVQARIEELLRYEQAALIGTARFRNQGFDIS